MKHELWAFTMSDNWFTVHHSRIPFQQGLAGNTIHLWRRLHLQKLVGSGALGQAEFLHWPFPFQISWITTSTYKNCCSIPFLSREEQEGEPRQAQGSSPSCRMGEAALPQPWQRHSHTPAPSLRCLWDVANAPWEKNLLPKGTRNSQEPFLLPKGERSERFLADSAPPKNVHLRESL